ncbi:hypothetical protein HK100_001885 [Physocladia obscura]|uniref:RNA-binding protein n=1 Tax=Physocladia obscura TaxID=109957 RepID=A0AAD5XE78_9FUNG|nr:hypothetical protein HK100_001885 [Physocladia obscura]
MRKAGDVVFADVLTMPGGRSKGCGVVEYGTADEAQRAIEELNDTPLMGRNVFIREDREPDLKFGDRRSGPGGGGSSGGGSRGGPNPCGVFVSNLPYIVAWQDLKDLFRQAGSVTRADVQEGPDRRSKGSGIVVFETSADAQNAISMFNGYEWHGRKIEDLGSRGGDGGADRGDRGDRGDREYSRSRGGGSGGDNRACFKCGKSGHIARDCRDGGGGPYRDYPPRRDYYDQGRGGYGGGYDRGYGPPRGGPYGYNQRGYDDYYGGRGGYGGGGGGYSGGPPGGYRDYPPSRGGYNDFPPRGPPMPGGPGGMNPYNDYGPPNHGPKDFSGRDYQSGQGSHVQGSNIYGNF